MKAGSCGYFWKETFPKFARNTVKTLAVAWPCQCVKQPEHQHLLLQGLHPSRASGSPAARKSGSTAAGAESPRIMDAGPVTVSGLSGHAVPQWPRLPIRRLRTGDTLRTFANGRVAQHPVDPLGIDRRLVFRDYW